MTKQKERSFSSIVTMAANKGPDSRKLLSEYWDSNFYNPQMIRTESPQPQR